MTGIQTCALPISKETLDELSIPYYSVHWLSKGISENIEEPNKAKAIRLMEQLEEKLKEEVRNKRMPKFGYKRSESLFALESNNIPNNVFPIFWWKYLKDNTVRKTLFSRI